MKKNNPFNELINYLEPFFFNKRLTVVDIGANEGVFIESFIANNLKIQEYIGVEPSEEAFNELSSKLTNLRIKHPPILLNAILSDVNDVRKKIKLAGTMTKVVSDEFGSVNIKEVQSYTLDEIEKLISELPVSILKIDVEGYEREVLSGGGRFLREQKADFVLLEAGFKKEGKQQVYFSDLVEILSQYGYSVVRIFEQKHEWIEDSIALRRANILFSSSRFISNNPNSRVITDYENMKRLGKRKDVLLKINALKQRLSELEKEVERLENEL